MTFNCKGLSAIGMAMLLNAYLAIHPMYMLFSFMHNSRWYKFLEHLSYDYILFGMHKLTGHERTDIDSEIYMKFNQLNNICLLDHINLLN